MCVLGGYIGLSIYCWWSRKSVDGLTGRIEGILKYRVSCIVLQKYRMRIQNSVIRNDFHILKWLDTLLFGICGCLQCLPQNQVENWCKAQEQDLNKTNDGNNTQCPCYFSIKRKIDWSWGGRHVNSMLNCLGTCISYLDNKWQNTFGQGCRSGNIKPGKSGSSTKANQDSLCLTVVMLYEFQRAQGNKATISQLGGRYIAKEFWKNAYM